MGLNGKGSGAPEGARKSPPRKRAGTTTPHTNVLRAKALEMIAGGATVEEAARAVRRAPDTVREWQAALRPAIDARLAAVTAGIADGAAEAKLRLRGAAPEAADLALRIMRADVSMVSDVVVGRGDDAKVAKILDPALLRVRLQAALAALDRGGVPAKSETEHSGAIGGTAPEDPEGARRWHASALVRLSGGSEPGAREVAIATLLDALASPPPSWLMDRLGALARRGLGGSGASLEADALDEEPANG